MTDPGVRGVWNESVLEQAYGSAHAQYQEAVLDQYKLAVEMADRVSQRRMLANTFFLTLNSAIFLVIATFWRSRPEGSEWLLALPLAMLLLECFVWYRIVMSYRQLNSAKLHVVGELETKLPASPFWKGEWSALGYGKDPELYTPLARTERWIPILFASAYVLAFTLALVVP